MTLSQIAFFAALGLVYAAVIPARWRGWTLYLISLFAIYALQPTLNIRWLDYSLPTATLLLAVGGWWLTRPQTTPDTEPQTTSRRRDDIAALIVMLFVALLLIVPRYVELPFTFTSRPPEVTGAALAMIAGEIDALTYEKVSDDGAFATFRFSKPTSDESWEIQAVKTPEGWRVTPPPTGLPQN